MSTVSRWLPMLGLLLCLLYPSGAAAAEEARVAALDVIGDMPEAVLSVVTDQVRAGALNALPADAYNVMTQESMRALLEEMGVDPDACARAANCEVDYGQRIGAALVVSGKVVEVDGTKILTLKLFDAKKAKMLSTAMVKAKGAEALIDKTLLATAVMIREGLGLETPQRRGRVEEEQGQLGGSKKKPRPSKVKKPRPTKVEEPLSSQTTTGLEPNELPMNPPVSMLKPKLRIAGGVSLGAGVVFYLWAGRVRSEFDNYVFHSTGDSASSSEELRQLMAKANGLALASVGSGLLGIGLFGVSFAVDHQPGLLLTASF